jgi:hypothetical protein
MKCIVDGCINEDWQGDFEGDICVPCFKFAQDIYLKRELKDRNSQFARNIMNEARILIRNSEISKINIKK